MITQQDLSAARAQLFTRAQLLRAGRTSGAIDVAVASGKVTRVRPGWYTDTSKWQALYAEQRHLLRVIASAEKYGPTGAHMSHYSAAVLHGLPLFRLSPEEPVHLTASRGAGSSSARTVRHRPTTGTKEGVSIHGISCTTLARTVIDLARTASPELGLGCADAALKQVAERDGDWKAWRRETLLECEKSAGGRGMVRARHVLSLAEPSADSVFESVSRLYLGLLGFEVQTQVRVRGPNGNFYITDFELVECGVFGEVDGRVKYTDAAMTRGQSAEQVFFAEKQREDWIRGTTGNRIIRWGAKELVSLEVFAKFLRSCGLRPHMPVGFPW